MKCVCCFGCFDSLFFVKTTCRPDGWWSLRDIPFPPVHSCTSSTHEKVSVSKAYKSDVIAACDTIWKIVETIYGTSFEKSRIGFGMFFQTYEIYTTGFPHTTLSSPGRVCDFELFRENKKLVNRSALQFGNLRIFFFSLR